MEVIILAGGLGTRLNSVVKDVPKCMADVAGHPFLWYLLRYLSRYKVVRVVLALGHLRDVVIDWIDRCAEKYPFSIDYSIEKVPLGTGGAIKNAMEKTTMNDVAVINGDTFYNVDLDALYKMHRLLPSSVTLALKPMRDFDRYGNVKMDTSNNQIWSFEEKKHCEYGLINGGIYVIKKLDDIFGGLNGAFSFETDVLQPLSLKGRVYGMKYNGNFIDIGMPEDYEMAGKLLPKWINFADEIK